jgi:hypothetical protein
LCLPAIAGRRHKIERLLRKDGGNLQLAAERLNVLSEGGEIDVLLAFDA